MEKPKESAWERFKFVIGTPRRTFKFLYKVYKEGYFEVVTPFSYKNKEFCFRTVVQPDADIIQFIPELNSFPNDPKWLPFYKKQYAKHLTNTHDYLKLIVANEHVWVKLFDMVLIVLNVLPVLTLGYDWYTNASANAYYWAFAGVAVGVLMAIFRKWIFGKIMKYGGKIVWGIASFFMKKRVKKITG